MAPVTISRAMMPLAWPSTITTSSTSWRGNMATRPSAIWRSSAGKARADDDDVVLPLVGWIDEFVVRLRVLPLARQRAGRDLAVQFHCGGYLTIPMRTATGNETFAAVITSAKAVAKIRFHGLNL